MFSNPTDQLFHFFYKNIPWKSEKTIQLTKHNSFHHPHTHRAWVRKLVDQKLLTFIQLKIIKSEFHGISGIFDSAKHKFDFKIKDLK